MDSLHDPATAALYLDQFVAGAGHCLTQCHGSGSTVGSHPGMGYGCGATGLDPLGPPSLHLPMRPCPPAPTPTPMCGGNAGGATGMSGTASTFGMLYPVAPFVKREPRSSRDFMLPSSNHQQQQSPVPGSGGYGVRSPSSGDGSGGYKDRRPVGLSLPSQSGTTGGSNGPVGGGTHHEVTSGAASRVAQRDCRQSSTSTSLSRVTQRDCHDSSDRKKSRDNPFV